MLVEKFKEICLAYNWDFNYGNAHWQNLQDFELDDDKPFHDRKKHFLLLWKDREIKLDKYSSPVAYEFTGEFVFCVHSKVDDKDYNHKYQYNIKHLEQEVQKAFNEFTICEPWIVSRWKEVEVENEYDTNVDGLRIEFTITQDEE